MSDLNSQDKQLHPLFMHGGRAYVQHLAVNAFCSLDDCLLPRIVALGKNLYALVFSIMKLLPAKHMIKSAMLRGEIQQGFSVVATSSGTFALGVGAICAELNLPFTIFGDPAIDDHLYQLLSALGGNIQICQKTKIPGAYQKLRLDALRTFINENSLSYWLRQYDNLDNALAYSPVAELIHSQFSDQIHLVGSVGSGGSTGGIMTELRKSQPQAKLIGVDTFNSVLFGQPNGPRLLRGLGNTILPGNLNHSLYDEVHWVAANEAFYFTRQLYQQHHLFCGPTSGAAYQVASYLATKHPENLYLFTCPDGGFRYQKTVYSDTWLSAQPFYGQKLADSPVRVDFPLSAKIPWAFIEWRRRSYKQVIRNESSQ